MAKRQFRSFQELNQARLGLVGIVLTALVLAVCLNIGKLRSALEDTSYHASFAESGAVRQFGCVATAELQRDRMLFGVEVEVPGNVAIPW